MQGKENKMMRQWQYIANRCIKADLHEAAVIAIEIDALFIKLGYKTFTESWIRYYGMLGSMSLLEVADEVVFNTGCFPNNMQNHQECKNCEFQHNGGQYLVREWMELFSGSY